MMRIKTKKRLDRDDWINASFKTLHEEGIDQVRIERVARKLGVTKGSFYWHFKDRDALLDVLLEYWAHEMTQTVLNTAKKFHGPPMDRLYNAIREVIGKERARYDPAVRAWARSDPRAQKAVNHIDKIRLSFLHGLFIDVGFNDKEAEIRARLIYYYIIGEWVVTVREPMRKRLAELERKLDILTHPVG
ncbi:MAG: TetR/AcrR family transcriptional regulator [Gammaproteobacteria bacterium]